MQMECPVCDKSFTMARGSAEGSDASGFSEDFGKTVMKSPKAMPFPSQTGKRTKLKQDMQKIFENAVMPSPKAMPSSLQTGKRIKLKRNIQKLFFILSILFFLAACVVFVEAVLTNSTNRSGYGSESVYTGSSYSISVGESSHGTYKNAQNIASNTDTLIGLVSKKNLFNISYGLFGIAIFLLLVSICINQIWHFDVEHED